MLKMLEFPDRQMVGSLITIITAQMSIVVQQTVAIGP